MTSYEVTQRFVQSYYNLYQRRMVSTKKQFGDIVGVLPTNFRLMEKGERQCTTQHICNLFNKYGINPVWLFTGSGHFYANGDD